MKFGQGSFSYGRVLVRHRIDHAPSRCLGLVARLFCSVGGRSVSRRPGRLAQLLGRVYPAIMLPMQVQSMPLGMQGRKKYYRTWYCQYVLVWGEEYNSLTFLTPSWGYAGGRLCLGGGPRRLCNH